MIAPLWICPLALAILIILLLGWRTEMKRRQRRLDELAHQAAEREQIANARIPEGNASIVTEVTGGEIREGLMHSLMPVAIGTFGWKQLLRVLTVLNQCGLDGLVGGILVQENDAQLRSDFDRELPDVYGGRVVYGFSKPFEGGMSNRPMAWVMGQIRVWGRPILRSVESVIYKHLWLTQNGSPSRILVFQSLGGQAAIGIPVVKLLHERFEEAQLLAFTAIPRHGRLRERFEELKPYYDGCDCAGWIPTDNLGDDPTTQDYGMVMLIVGLCDASMHADQTTELGNALALALPKQPGGILRYEITARSLAAYPFQPDPEMPPEYYVSLSAVAQEADKALEAIERGKGLRAVELPAGEAEASTFDVLVVPFSETDLARIGDEIAGSRRLDAQYNSARTTGTAGSGNLFGQANYELVFASVPAVIDPERPVSPLIALRFTALRDSGDLVRQVVKTPQERSLLATQTQTSAAEKKNLPGLDEPAAARAKPRAGDAPAVEADIENEGVIIDAAEHPQDASAGGPAKLENNLAGAQRRRYRLRPTGFRRVRKERRYVA